jgi:protein-tyrosine phosphatase
MKILMVCLGNICRSPLAEGILRAKIEAEGLSWEVDSVGIGAWHMGEAPDRRSIAIARRHGIDISSQRARRLQAADLEAFDLIFAMDEQNYQDILRLDGKRRYRHKVSLLMSLAHPDKKVSIPDPYWNDDGFEKVFQMIEQACEALVRRYGRGEGMER